MLPVERLIAKWKSRFSLRGWKVRYLDEPPPSKSIAYCEYEFPTKEAIIWATTEEDVIHEVLHLVFAGLDDVFWRATPMSALRTLWKRREEQAIERLTKAFAKMK